MGENEILHMGRLWRGSSDFRVSSKSVNAFRKGMVENHQFFALLQLAADITACSRLPYMTLFGEQ